MVLVLMLEASAPMCLGRGAGSSVIDCCCCCSVAISSSRSWVCASSVLVEKQTIRCVVVDDCWKSGFVVVSLLLLGDRRDGVRSGGGGR